MKLQFDYCLGTEVTLVPGTWMSFFDTEEAHAVMHDEVGDEGGRATFEVRPTSPGVEVCAGDGRPPGSSGKSRLKAPS
ncbi:MAG TPA: hypothetical protein VMW89_19015 [Desulfatiglandales bacterium]|nr:hypothetical protein [Desulfatiglandales bacterium]